MSDVYVWDPFKYPKIDVSIVDALMTLVKDSKIEIIDKFSVKNITFSSFKVLNASISRQNFFFKFLVNIFLYSIFFFYLIYLNLQFWPSVLKISYFSQSLIFIKSPRRAEVLPFTDTFNDSLSRNLTNYKHMTHISLINITRYWMYVQNFCTITTYIN